MAAATAASTMIAVARPIEVSTPTPVTASEVIAITTVPPANTTAEPEEPIALSRATRLGWPAARFSR
jgi:hypothetical protein